MAFDSQKPRSCAANAEIRPNSTDLEQQIDPGKSAPRPCANNIVFADVSSKTSNPSRAFPAISIQTRRSEKRANLRGDVSLASRR